MTDFQDKKKVRDEAINKYLANKEAKPKPKPVGKVVSRQRQIAKVACSTKFAPTKLFRKDAFTSHDLMHMSPEKVAKAIKGITRGKDIFSR